MFDRTDIMIISVCSKGRRIYGDSLEKLFKQVSQEETVIGYGTTGNYWIFSDLEKYPKNFKKIMSNKEVKFYAYPKKKWEDLCN